MIVTTENIERVLDEIDGLDELAFDLETTGVRPYHDDHAFSIIISDGDRAWYFPVRTSNGVTLSDTILITDIKDIFKINRVYIGFNVKFDMRFLTKMGVEFHPDATIHCAMVSARLLNNQLKSYSLDNCCDEFLGERKDDRVKAFIEEHELWTELPPDGDTKKRQKKYHFDQVPLDLIVPYAEKDAILTFKLWRHIRDCLGEFDEGLEPHRPQVSRLVPVEAELTKTLFRMEHKGVRLDASYALSMIELERKRYADAISGFATLTGEGYRASGKALSAAFSAVGISPESLPKTDKGNFRSDAATMAEIDHSAAKFVLTCKDAKAAINFYAGFLREEDPGGFIHTDFRQSGTATGRLSSSQPNLQNLTSAEDDGGSEVRRCIVPDSADHCLVMIDYRQMEYRLMLDYALQMDIIEAVKGGADVHQAMADRVGINRQQAKTLNFALLYGAGSSKIASMLGTSETEASQIIQQFYGALPDVEEFMRKVRGVAKSRGYIQTWTGRILRFPNKWESYRAVNHLIQGGSGDIARRAMIACDRDLKNLDKTRSRLSLMIHDELVFNIHKAELDVVPYLVDAMRMAYPEKHLPMDVDVSHSWKSLGDKVKGLPFV